MISFEIGVWRKDNSIWSLLMHPFHLVVLAAACLKDLPHLHDEGLGNELSEREKQTYYTLVRLSLSLLRLVISMMSEAKL